jgi:hypothetical protein
MTEAEWLKCKEPGPMLDFLGYRASERKLRLFAAACCRRVWHLLTHQESKESVEALEQYADGLLPSLTNAWVAASDVRDIRKTGKKDSLPEKTAAWAVSLALLPETFRSVQGSAIQVMQAGHVTPAQEGKRQCADLRDLFGNLLRPVSVKPAWRAPTALALAQAAYEERSLPSGELDNARLAVLADALEEAGCTSADVLDHLRSPGRHLRGCWPLDLLLAKE